MPMIRECIVVTMDDRGAPYIAPFGLIEEADSCVIAPFRPSQTLENLLRIPFLTANVTDDVRVFAGCLTGRRNWPVTHTLAGKGFFLANAIAHRELEVMRVEDNAVRPRLHCRVLREIAHKPAPGFNRAQAAVVEATILASRLMLLDEAKIRNDLAYLSIAVEKTAGEREKEAWGWLMEKIDTHFDGTKIF